MTTWRRESARIESKGVNSQRATSLADLHRRRRETQSQFFTPEWVAKGIWQSLSYYVNAMYVQRVGARVNVVDTSIGSGALFESAPVEKIALYGSDKDARCIQALSNDARAANMEFEFITGGLENLVTRHFDIAVINPPFSITLESPHLTPFACTSFGRFGAGTSAVSHEYALAQSLDCARVVAAVLPSSMEEYCRRLSSLVHIVELPLSTFLLEGAKVQTSVFFFSRYHKGNVSKRYFGDHGCWGEDLKIGGIPTGSERPTFRMMGIDEEESVITLPVTGNKKVELHHHNRRVVMKFHCGLVEAKVSNGILKESVIADRPPRDIRYSGDGKLLLDVMLLQENPKSQLGRLVSTINQFGGEAQISPTLQGFYKKLIKRNERAKIPMRRWVLGNQQTSLSAIAKKRVLLNPDDLNSPSIGRGEKVSVKPLGGEYQVEFKGATSIIRKDQFALRFDIIENSSNENTWYLKYPGLCAAFPNLEREQKRKVQNAGIDWLAPFQLDSLCEGLISPYGFLGAWEQGSGKARYALAMALLHSGKNLVVVESGLMPELLKEIEKLQLPDSLWQKLSVGDMPTKKICLVSYGTLRNGVRVAYTRKTPKGVDETIIRIKRTQADKWRRLFNAVICDEGGLLANLHTQQTSAVKMLCARKLVVLDGTPQRNYPRDLLPLAVATAGNGVAHQPYGVKGKASINARLIESANHCQRGEDLFYDRHVVTQWVTHEFREDMQTGGKREVPKINNLSVFRSWLAPNIQRRLRAEPELAIFNNCPKPERIVFDVAWDEAHLAHYLKVATEFKEWYVRARQDGRRCNLVSVLARIGAVQRAANSPSVVTPSSFCNYHTATSKERFAIDRVQHWVNAGRKVILYASSPDVLERLKFMLQTVNIDAVLFTGKQNIDKRALALDNEFRYGSTPVLLSSWVGQRGLNLEQAGAIVFFERDWSATTEEQAIYRTQRKDQKLKVVVEYLHLSGSIDQYCAQMVLWKKKSAEAGLDFGEQVGEDEEYLHLDTLLHRFCSEAFDASIYDVKNLLVA